MPEYSQLQTTIKYDSSTFENSLEMIGRFFTTLGFKKDLIEEWVSKIEWIVEDNGFVYTGCNMTACSINFIDGTTLSMRPIIMGMSKSKYEYLPHDTLIIEVLFHTEEIFDYKNNKYKHWFMKIVKEVALLLKEYFFEFGIYLTDEITDMEALDSVIMVDNKNIWAFDFALIPEQYFDIYANLPSNYIHTKFEEILMIFDKDSWKEIL